MKGGENMKIEKTKSGTYRVRQQSDGKRICVTFPYKPTPKEAAIAIAERLQEESKTVDGTFLHYAEEYIANRSTVLSQASLRTYKTYLKMISDNFKAKKLYSINQSDIQTEINLFNKTHQPKTTRSLHGFIYAVLKEKRPSMVIKTSLPQIVKRKGYLPTEEDINAVLEYVKGTEDEYVFKLGIMGLRRGEICALTLDDFTDDGVFVTKGMVFDTNHNWIVKSTPKTDNSNRFVPLQHELVENIRKQGYIFKESPAKLNEHLKKVLNELGIPHFRFHDLRHYFASYAHSIGIPDADILAIGGWKTEHVMKDVYRESMEKSRSESSQKLLNTIY